MLYPQDNAHRTTHSLDGIWHFKKDGYDVDLDPAKAKTALTDPMRMPVPSSYNDLTQDVSLRDHVGLVWYERVFTLPPFWDGGVLTLRFGAVAHHATVFLDGVELGHHKGGFLPFQFDITDGVKKGQIHRLTLAVDNRLDRTCLPMGELVPSSRPEEKGKRLQNIHFDFFNYSGIHREVTLVYTPKTHITQVQLDTTCEATGPEATLAYRVETTGGEVGVELLDAAGHTIGEASGAHNTMALESVQRWAPGRPYLYTARVTLSEDGKIVDQYEKRCGFRHVEVRDGQFFVNGAAFYFKGFGKHEDSHNRGRAHDPVQMLKDYELLDWIHANSYRTSHYPYHEAWLDEADERGILVIDETPAVGLWYVGEDRDVFVEGSEENAALLKHHRDVLSDLIQRDRHHPSVVMWSIANEPATWQKASRPYWEDLFKLTRELDPSRPVTVVECGDLGLVNPNDSQVADLVDVITFNRYPSWYLDAGRLETIEPSLKEEFQLWWDQWGKPIIITEYGADTIPGLHLDPPGVFSEEYQRCFLEACHRAFDALPFVIGEHVWNFADFRTKQGITRVDGNKKGIFTRTRQPKSAAFDLKERWGKKA